MPESAALFQLAPRPRRPGGPTAVGVPQECKASSVDKGDIGRERDVDGGVKLSPEFTGVSIDREIFIRQ
jgi:hypothetical protein